MSSTAKIITGVVVLVIVLGGAYYWYTSKNGPGGQSAEMGQAANNTETTTLPSGKDTSDAALNQDLNSIDTQMQGVSSDNANVSASVNAQAAQ